MTPILRYAAQTVTAGVIAGAALAGIAHADGRPPWPTPSATPTRTFIVQSPPTFSPTPTRTFHPQPQPSWDTQTFLPLAPKSAAPARTAAKSPVKPATGCGASHG